MRGARYAWANAQAPAGRRSPRPGSPTATTASSRPTTELRQLQYAADERNGVGKRSRAVLDPEYGERYVHEILDAADLDALVAELPADAATALLCVEADPEACHRSLDRRALRALRAAVAHVRPAAAAAISARR